MKIIFMRILFFSIFHIIINNKLMKTQTTFSEGLKEYIKKALQIWPGLQICLRHIQDASRPAKNSYLPNRNYNSLNPQQFIETVAQDMHSYIMEHDVKAQHIEQYLQEILILFNTQQQNHNTLRFMSRQLEGLIYDLQQGNTNRLFEIRDLYQRVKIQPLNHEKQGYSDSQDQQEQEDEQENQDIWIQQREQENQQQIIPQLTNEEKQQLEDDGWNVVCVKKKKR